MSFLTDKNVYFPTGSAQRLVGLEATEFVNENLQMIRENQYFCVLKGIVTPNRNDPILAKLPFLAFDVDGKKNLSICKSCTVYKNKNICQHTEEKRQFSCTLLFEDLQYAIKELNYKFEVQIIYYWQTKKHLKTFSDFSYNLLQLRKVPINKYASGLVKEIFLSGMGRFALNIAKLNESAKLINSYQSLCFLLKESNVNSFHIIPGYKDKCILYRKGSNGFKENMFKSTRAMCFSVFFAILSNSTRRKVHFDAIQVLKSNHLRLIRIDVDSILIAKNICVEALLDEDKIFCRKDTNNCINYKIEETKLKFAFSLTKRNYGFMRFDNTSVLKFCGLHLNLKERIDINAENIFFSKFNTENIKFKNIEPLFFDSNCIIIESYPFGSNSM